MIKEGGGCSIQYSKQVVRNMTITLFASVVLSFDKDMFLLIGVKDTRRGIRWIWLGHDPDCSSVVIPNWESAYQPQASKSYKQIHNYSFAWQCLTTVSFRLRLVS